MNIIKKVSLIKRIDQHDSILFSEKDKSFTHPSNTHQDYNSGSKESQKMFWGLDEENGDSESLIDELQGELFLPLSTYFIPCLCSFLNTNLIEAHTYVPQSS
jgi:hypothetical protein